jgi:hypothetical protein
MTTGVAAFAVLAGLIGLVVGAVLGLNGFAQPVSTTALSQTPRIKNIGWLLTGFFVIYLADPKRIGLPDDFPLLYPFVAYGVGAIIGVFCAIGWMVTSIRSSVRAFQSVNPLGSDIDASALVREYLTYGKARFDDAWDKEKARAQQTAENRRRQLALEADGLAADCIYSITRQLGAQRRLPESDLMDAILRAICARATAITSRPLVLRPSYFAFVAHRQADNEVIDNALFTADMPGRYSGYLVLRRGSQRVSREVILPISSVPAQVLPGAPEAVLLQGYSVLNRRNIRFREEISKQVQGEVREFYRHPYFDPIASITSLLVFDRDTFHGVVNIESSEPNLLGTDENELRAVVESLQPLVALLAVFR